MPAYIVKLTPDEDFYVLWSTVVDNITFAGTRVDVAAYHEVWAAGIEPGERFERADANGTSALWPEDAATGADYYLGWNTDKLLVSNDDFEGSPNQFLIKRADLRQYVERGPKGIWIPCEDDESDASTS